MNREDRIRMTKAARIAKVLEFIYRKSRDTEEFYEVASSFLLLAASCHKWVKDFTPRLFCCIDGALFLFTFVFNGGIFSHLQFRELTSLEALAVVVNHL